MLQKYVVKHQKRIDAFMSALTFPNQIERPKINYTV